MVRELRARACPWSRSASPQPATPPRSPYPECAEQTTDQTKVGGLRARDAFHGEKGDSPQTARPHCRLDLAWCTYTRPGGTHRSSAARGAAGVEVHHSR